MRRRALLRPAVLLGAAIVALRLDTALSAALLVSALVLLALGLFAPRALALLDRGGLRLATAAAALLGSALSFAIWLLILLPLWLINLMVRFRPLSSGWVTSSSAWTRSRDHRSPDIYLQNYHWQVALDPPMSRDPRGAGPTCEKW